MTLSLDAPVAARRTFARVDLDAVARNYRQIEDAAGVTAGVTIVAVVKADAYGHGAVEVARALHQAGARHFAVASIEEGIELRGGGIDGEILVLGGLQRGESEAARAHRLTPFIHDVQQLARWGAEAARAGARLPFHIEIDTGMERLGFGERDVGDLAQHLDQAAHLRLEGIGTHLAAAEDFDSPQTEEQSRRFQAIVADLAAHGIRPKYVHIANSAAVAFRPELDFGPGSDLHPEVNFNMVRPGLALYGYLSRTIGKAPASRLALKPTLEWKARLVAIRDVPSGARLGYHGTHFAFDPMRVGVVSIGYADGFSRRMSNGGQVVVRAKRCPVVGLVSMDLTMVDLSEVPEASVDDEVTLIGPSINACEMATRCGTIPYEVLCGISKRVPRVY